MNKTIKVEYSVTSPGHKLQVDRAQILADSGITGEMFLVYYDFF